MTWEKVALDLAERAGVEIPRNDLVDGEMAPTAGASHLLSTSIPIRT